MADGWQLPRVNLPSVSMTKGHPSPLSKGLQMSVQVSTQVGNELGRRTSQDEQHVASRVSMGRREAVRANEPWLADVGRGEGVERKFWFEDGRGGRPLGLFTRRGPATRRRRHGGWGRRRLDLSSLLVSTYTKR